MTEIVKQEEKASEDEIIKVKKSVVVEYILKDRKQHMKMQQERYRHMREIDKMNMRILLCHGAMCFLLALIFLWNVIDIIATRDFSAVLLGALNVITLFMFATQIDSALHWWDEEEERTGGYLADTETD
ncbi:hypothetical protein ACT414_18780 (plasmid) [Acinetobacter baumannii]